MSSVVALISLGYSQQICSQFVYLLLLVETGQNELKNYKGVDSWMTESLPANTTSLWKFSRPTNIYTVVSQVAKDI